jgi:hypothetical protein
MNAVRVEERERKWRNMNDERKIKNWITKKREENNIDDKFSITGAATELQTSNKGG